MRQGTAYKISLKKLQCLDLANVFLVGSDTVAKIEMNTIFETGIKVISLSADSYGLKTKDLCLPSYLITIIIGF